LLTLGHAGFTAIGPVSKKFLRRFFQKAPTYFTLYQAQTFTIDMALLAGAGAVVVDEMTWPSGFVTVIVIAPLEPFVTVAVSTPEDDGAEGADVDGGGATDTADFAAMAEPVAPGVAVGEPAAAMSLRLAPMLMISSPNPSGVCSRSLAALDDTLTHYG
jgi:hypothetical protein